tara:strand:- start:2631 stop:4325 length:1695 start_codon:yes stop_codon:yes gene_type:complete
VREVSRRILGLYPYDVQILGALALARGTIAELATGEGKTLLQLLPAYYHSLSGKGVHVATANSYLAERDHAFGLPVYQALGISSALLPERVSVAKKRVAYQADITYGTGSEFGFDYLRDQLTLLRQPESVPGERTWKSLLGSDSRTLPLAQRGLHMAIIDEADAILIDEATTPLLISGKSHGENPGTSLYHAARNTIALLEEGLHFGFDAIKRQIWLTESGQQLAQAQSREVDRNLLKRPWIKYVENALRAQYALDKDRQYVVRNNEVLIIDECTGRVKQGSSWRDGLHQAVEAKEDQPITCENESQASISRQKFYRLYDHVGGMTGTAVEAAGEFWEVYQLPVVPIPLNKPSQRRTFPPRVFRTSSQKLNAAVVEIRRLYHTGQPVLVGTRTIENSERLSLLLNQAGIPHHLLNAKQDEGEAEVIAAAGQPHAVTISTNMAGRGTHIDLGDGVEALGGLHVLVLEMDESQRVDRQLLGRAARQGKVGSGQLFLSLEDSIMTRFAPDLAKRMAEKFEDSAEELPSSLSSRFLRVQSKAEQKAYQDRLAIMEQDRWNDETKLRLA